MKAKIAVRSGLNQNGLANDGQPVRLERVAGIEANHGRCRRHHDNHVAGDRIIHVTTYASLRQYYTTFSEGNLPLLVVTGRGGTAKSTLAVEIVRDAIRIDCHVTACGLYRQLFIHRNKVLIIDDVDALAGDRQTVPVLKALCETRHEKTIGWYTAKSKMVADGEEVPGELPDHFTTTSRAVIISNDWKTLNKNVAALNDRGLVINYEPTNAEIHRYVVAGGWFKDEEILGFVQQHLNVATKLSMRDYIKALEIKNGGMDWQSVLLGYWDVDPLMGLTIELMNNIGMSPKRRCETFCQATGKVQKTWYNYREQFLATVGSVEATVVAPASAGAAPIRRSAEKSPVTIIPQTESTLATGQ